MRLRETETWIPVEISDGAFTSEYAISIKCLDGQEISLFADKTQVKTEGDQSYLSVTKVNSDPINHKRTVLLPTEAFETGSRWVDLSQ